MLLIMVLLSLMCFHETVESKECKKSEIIVGRVGEKLVFEFSFDELTEKYNKYAYDHEQNEIQIQDLKRELIILFQKEIIFENGKATDSAGRLTEIFLNYDTLTIIIKELQREDTGIYSIHLNGSTPLGQKVLIITGKPKIKKRTPPIPVLKAEDTTTLQLECNSVSTSMHIGECQLGFNSMYILWYKNGMRMTELDPTLSQINVTVDHNEGKFMCLTTEYKPCFQRLQTTKHFNDVLNIAECDNVSERKTFIVSPQYAPIDVKLEPDQREITINEYEDLNVRCSAKCNPNCDITWKKDFKSIESSDTVNITQSLLGNDLKIGNISRSDEGTYLCLVNNTHGEAEKIFTLIVRENSTLKMDTNESETETYDLLSSNFSIEQVVVILVVCIVVLCIVLVFTKLYKKNQKEVLKDTEKNNYGNGIQKKRTENINYAVLELITPNEYKIHGNKSEVVYTNIDFTKKAPPMPKNLTPDSDEED